MKLEHFPKSGNRFLDKKLRSKNKELEQISDSIKSHSALIQPTADMRAKVMVFASLFCFSFLLVFTFCLPLHAQSGDIPRFFGSNERLERPELRAVRLRFLTTVDFPPFNYIDNSGNLAGYHIDLARSICLELKLADRCQIEAVEWDQLTTRLKNGGAEAMIAGMAANHLTRADFSFSRPYIRLPARFLTSDTTLDAESLRDMINRTEVGSGVGPEVGIVRNTAHEKMFAAYFPTGKILLFDDYQTLTQALTEKRLSLAFGDGMQFSLWLASTTNQNCCHFVGGAYYGADYLGQGLRLGVPTRNKILVRAFDYALNILENKGKLTELYLRYFPVGFY